MITIFNFLISTQPDNKILTTMELNWKEETQKKAAKWDSLMKWIKESSETYDSDCDNDRDVDTIWDILDSLDYQELNSKDNN